jgi:hypothetical protein
MLHLEKKNKSFKMQRKCLKSVLVGRQGGNVSGASEGDSSVKLTFATILL